jgi:hypothetical protein
MALASVRLSLAPCVEGFGRTASRCHSASGGFERNPWPRHCGSGGRWRRASFLRSVCGGIRARAWLARFSPGNKTRKASRVYCDSGGVGGGLRFFALYAERFGRTAPRHHSVSGGFERKPWPRHCGSGGLEEHAPKNAKRRERQGANPQKTRGFVCQGARGRPAGHKLSKEARGRPAQKQTVKRTGSYVSVPTSTRETGRAQTVKKSTRETGTQANY